GMWLLLLLQDVQTAPQTSLTPSRSCDTLENWFYDETSGSCCYQCPSGYVKKKACPRDPGEDCLRCGPEQYVNEENQRPQCDACVSCADPDLVEKEPCASRSGRVCECRPGLFCQDSLVNTCTRCQQHTLCEPGFGVKVRGTSTNDVTCEKCPPGTFSELSSSTDICKPHTNCASLNKVVLSEGNATHDQVCLDQLPTHLTPSTLSMRSSNETSNSDLRSFEENLVTVASILSATTENPSSTPEKKVLAGTFPTSAKGEATTGGLVLWGVVVSVIVLLVGMMLFWKWKVCQKRILILKAKREFLKLYCIAGCLISKEPEEEELIGKTLPLEANNNLVSSTEKAHGPEVGVTDVTQGSGAAPDCPVDSQVRDHTNNRIENLYILKADTVIVGSISEVPSGKNCAARGCESNVDAQENTEEELEMHYPEQETESFPENDVTVPVEEEGKEFHHPTTATEK
ncbi:Tumor necrosis factor receptor superfamily member 8, partial [Merops nubicus]